MAEILGTGLSGLVGSRIVELNPQYQFTDLSLDTGYDILKPESIEKVFAENPAEIVLHLAAFTDTNAAWDQKGDKSGLCYRLNVVGTQNIANLCKKYGKHLIHISTDFVFDGTKEKYFETDIPNPIDWYGQTKYEAEKIATGATIVRIAYPYRSNFPSKTDLVRKIKSKLENHETLNLFSDQITTPTFIDDIAKGLALIIDKKPIGIYHLVGSSSQSPYDMALLIAKTFDLDSSLIKASSLTDYLKTPDARPYAPNLALSNQKFVSKFGFTPKTLTEGLVELMRQFSPPPSLQN
jgi:dTDP-4-dehydrorhamnose reductase